MFDSFFSSLYVYHGEMKYDTGLKLNMLQLNYLITLDTFRECGYYNDNS
jgi:hypothetical protein